MLGLFLLKERLEQELKCVPKKYRKYWEHLKKKEAQADEETKKKWVLQIWISFPEYVTVSYWQTEH